MSVKLSDEDTEILNRWIYAAVVSRYREYGYIGGSRGQSIDDCAQYVWVRCLTALRNYDESRNYGDGTRFWPRRFVYPYLKNYVTRYFQNERWIPYDDRPSVIPRLVQFDRAHVNHPCYGARRQVWVRNL